jgi:hypothetical protein
MIQNIPELTSEVGLEGVNENSVEDLLQSHGESLTINEFRELAEQHIQSEFTDPDAEEEKTPVRELCGLPQQQHQRDHADYGPIHS